MAFAVRRMEIDFQKPAAIDDVLTIRTNPADVGRARIELAQEIWRDGERLVTAAVTVALIGPGGRALRLPPAIRAAFGAGVVRPDS
jgi:acyl-CoA thioester hydrolase